MKNHFHKIVVLCGILGIGLAGMVIANGALDDDVPAMMVSPSTIVLAKVDTISVHTNIDADTVTEDSLYLNGVAPKRVYVDNLGHIAAKFAVAKLGLTPGEKNLTLIGDIDGDLFSATDVVRVK